MQVDVQQSGKLKKIVMLFEKRLENLNASLTDPLGREHMFFFLLDAGKPQVPSNFIFVEDGKYYFFYRPRNPGVHKLKIFFKAEQKKHTFEQNVVM